MSNILSVPHFRQLGDGYCLPACIQMVLAYWGIHRDQLQLGRQLQIIQGAGVPAPRLLWLARGNLKVTYQSGTMADLQNALRQGVPPIIPLHTGQFGRLGDTWRDQEHQKFAHEFEQTMRVLHQFQRTSDEHIPFLLRKVQRVRDYLHQH